MCTHVSFDTHKAFRYAIKNAASSEQMQQLHEQYALWREKKPGRHLREINPDELERFYSPGKENAILPALVQGSDGPRLAQLRWGFIPNWRSDKPHGDPLAAVDRAKKGLDIGRITWNAASETMFDNEKRTWRDSAHDRRCVIFVNGFFAFHYKEEDRYPFYVAPSDGDVMAVAGLWDVATINDQEYITCAILTQEGNDAMTLISNGGSHPHRMPIVLHPDDFAQWLDPIAKGEHQKIEDLYKLIKHPEEGELTYVTVAKNEKQRVENNEQAQDLFEYANLEIDLKSINPAEDE